MVYKYFRIKVTLRILIIGIMMFFLVFALYRDKWYLTSAATLVLIFGLMSELIYFVEKYNRTFNKLLLSIKHKDFAKSFISGEEDNISPEQKNAFNEIINAFQNVRIEKESHYEYLQALIEHMTVGIICLEGQDTVYLVNTAAKNILNINLLNKIDTIKRVDIDLYKTLKEIKTSERKIIKTTIKNEMVQLLVWCTELKIRNKPLKIISFQNIKNELDQQELESWQKLIRILNHEIMNTVTPISSLSAEINDMLKDEKGDKRNLTEIAKDDMEDIYSGLKTIERRSKGLLKFVKTYKNIARLPKPNFEQLKVEDLFKTIFTLLEPELKKEKIKFTPAINETDMLVYADREMMEQVLINLVLNAKDAVKEAENPSIELKAFTFNDKVNIEVIDNGCGIEKEHADNIFVPFFTTKKNGSGIGLSLSRQIMILHGGAINIKSGEEKGTVVELRF
jgi:nitrogen fixation/metabolism regulation signal transduction histidine kinase